MCAKLLLQYIGSSNYDLLTSLAAPEDPKRLTYDKLIELLEKHFCPKTNIIVEQHKFLCEYQNDSDSITEYVAKLRKYVNNCEFQCECGKSVAEIFLGAQFIRGIRDMKIKEHLLQSNTLSFTEVIEKALALEASKINTQEISNSQGTIKSEDVNHVSRHRTNTSNTNNRNAHCDRNRNKSKRRIDLQNRSTSRINYQHLGINNLCLRCGRANHRANCCRIDSNRLKCNACGKSGHVSKVCIQTIMKQKSNNASTNVETNYVSSQNEQFNSINNIVDIFQKHSVQHQNEIRKYITDIYIEGKRQSFEVDSGAGYTLIPETDYARLNLKATLRKPSTLFRSYTGEVFTPIGFVSVEVEYQGRKSQEEMYIVPSKYHPILGRIWIRHLQINLAEIDKNNTNLSKSDCFAIDPIPNIFSEYKDIFEPKVGCIPNVKCSLKLRENAKPTFIKHRIIPYALREKVERELDVLEKTGIITKVNLSDWGSPLVVIPKPDGNVRLCVDYKIAVNQQLQAAHYPIRNIDEILNNLRNSKVFCRLDLYKAYLHVQVDQDSQAIQTISTHRGTYRMNRLSFGIKTAPNEFNRILEEILQDLDGTMSYFDDIIIHATSREECGKRLIRCLDRLKANDLHLNKDKCDFFKTEIQYLGYTVRYNQISKCQNKVEAIEKVHRPKNADDVRKFLGMVTYYSRFIPNASTLTYPLRKLLQKNYKFSWSSICEAAFIKLKQEISSDRVLVPFNPNLPITIACDASPTGIAGVLSNIIEGGERPVAFVSRSLTQAEQNYSQLDREALAIVFTVNKFYNYVYGQQFTLITDNKPLTRIFHQDSKLPAMTSSRLLRYATFLQNFNYKVQHRKAEEHQNVDFLSRSTHHQKVPGIETLLDEELQVICDQTINQISTHSITHTSIAEGTEQDKELSKMKNDIIQGNVENTDYSVGTGIIFKR
ncbi:hypothetical protein PPYR_07148 [Photinus pyralis]|uniref:Reverse transcriptase n=1 Tax=Photinus pyralis TaxID=7054 RepID=A0A5N4APX9_PHOPY|nr:hypothetical protein PPYR_07148 [Photinus pyralis]